VQAAVDLTSLLALRQLQRPGRPDGVARIVITFLAESELRLEALRQAIATDDSSALEHAAHALKGIAGTVGANQMHDLAMRLEQLGRDGRTAGAANMLTDLESALASARPIFHRLQDAV
jgi:HPt (histidine-containing phosphotransfer) domain-containing protein